MDFYNPSKYVPQTYTNDNFDWFKFFCLYIVTVRIRILPYFSFKGNNDND